ncbi:MAG: hypothetical protein ABFS39_19370 [Pseudomonadota bacterium]
MPKEYFGDPNHVIGYVTLDGEPVVEPNADYYVEGELDPLLFGAIDFFQGISFVIDPLPPGEHLIVLDAYFYLDSGDVEYHNTWTITVIPPGKE